MGWRRKQLCKAETNGCVQHMQKCFKWTYGEQLYVSTKKGNNKYEMIYIESEINIYRSHF